MVATGPGTTKTLKRSFRRVSEHVVRNLGKDYQTAIPLLLWLAMLLLLSLWAELLFQKRRDLSEVHWKYEAEGWSENNVNGFCRCYRRLSIHSLKYSRESE